MKVLFIITGLSVGGAETMLLKLLKTLDRQRFHVSVVSLTTEGELGAQVRALGLPLKALGMKRGVPDLTKLYRLTADIKAQRPDVVHTWMYHSDLIGGLAAKMAGVRQIIWGIRHSNLDLDQNKRSTLIVVKLCALFSYWLPTKILSCSNKALTEHTRAGYCARKFSVIPNGFDLACFRPSTGDREEVRSELGLTASTLLAGFIARFDPQKNHRGFVKAAALINASIPDAYFVLAGRGVDSDNHELVSLISSHSLIDRVYLLGERDDIPRLMASFDVLISPSNGEGFPNVLGEAMSSGVICAVTNAGDSAEIVGETGRVVTVGDMADLAKSVIELLQLSGHERRELGRRARERVHDNFDINGVTRQYEAEYLARGGL